MSDVTTPFETFEVMTMKFSTLAAALAVTVAAGAVAPSVALAANARHPYRNVNHANDAGNRKGDAETAKLNQQQLDQVKAGK
jgi:hypothetical protein